MGSGLPGFSRPVTQASTASDRGSRHRFVLYRCHLARPLHFPRHRHPRLLPWANPSSWSRFRCPWRLKPLDAPTRTGWRRSAPDFASSRLTSRSVQQPARLRSPSYRLASSWATARWMLPTTSSIKPARAGFSPSRPREEESGFTFLRSSEQPLNSWLAPESEDNGSKV